MPARVSPKKLLHSKWTAVQPRERERHFMVVGVVESEPPGSPIVSIELEAVYSGRIRVMPWRELTDPLKWQQGWV